MPKTHFSLDFYWISPISPNVVQIPVKTWSKVVKTQLIYAHRAENGLKGHIMHFNPNQTLDYLKLAMRALIMNIPVELVELILLSE